MLGRRNETADSFLSTIRALIADAGGRLDAPAYALVADIDRHQATAIIDRVAGEPPRRMMHLVPALTGLLTGGPIAAALGGTMSYNADVLRYNGRIKAISAVLSALQLSRTTIGLTEPEKVILPVMAQCYAQGAISSDAWSTFLTRFVWNDGSCVLEVPGKLASHKHRPLAEEALRALLKATQPSHSVMLQAAAETIARCNASNISLATRSASSAIPRDANTLAPGARWMTLDDFRATTVYTNGSRSNGLVIGIAENGMAVRFAGNESLISIGGPGTGKTQAQVIPNLLTYPGSAFVLDVKDELWTCTAGRRSQFGPVYRFAPTDPTGNSHGYNPFDLISTNPDEAALDCQSLAHQLIPDKPDLKDPFWEERARDYVWTFALTIALAAPSNERTLEHLSSYLAMPLAFDDLTSVRYRTSTTAKAIALLRKLAATTGITDLANNAMTIETALTSDSNRLESVFDTARRHVALFARAAPLRRALSRSDWHPLDLRNKPGTTVYFCLKPGELRAFAPLVRIVFQQHAAALTKDFTRKPNTLPITFFLDEMPQLGNLGALTDILDVGRGAGLRLWMFAQYLGQVRDIYGQKANGLVNACQVRCFLQPDNDAAEFVAPALGKTRDLFSGQERPLAEPHDLMGKAYHDTIVALARGERPARLSKLLAHQHYKHLMRIPPPAVAKSSP